MISARWVITAALSLAVTAVGIGYVRYFRGRPSIPTLRSVSTGATGPGLNRFRCDSDHVVADAAPPEIRAIEAQLYEQVVLSKYHQKFPLVVESVSIPVPILTSGPRDAVFFDNLPRELASWVQSGQRRIECSEQTIDRFPAGTLLIPEDRVVRSTRAQRVPGIDWTRFQERFPGTPALFAFSRAKVTTDGLDALVYYDRLCPNNCGEGEYVWLHREGIDRAWRVAKESAVWIS